MRRIALIVALIASGGALAAGVAGADDAHEYKLEMYNAFGMTNGSEVKVAGVAAGTVTELDVNEDKRAELTIELTGPLAVLGEDTQCSSEPQSLIAEYFIDCQPKGEPLPEGGTIPAEQVRQTVQNDLVLSTLRLPFKQRFQLLINEFGTALAGNPENLNEAIRLGAPALRDLHTALKLIADQNTVVRQLNVDSDEIIGKLTERTDDVVAFIREAGEAAAASAERRDDLSRNFDLLDDFLAELGPTMTELEGVARESTPLLADLRAAAPGLNTLALNLPAFNRATERSLVTLGNAAVPGTAALKRAKRDKLFQALADAGAGAPEVARQATLLLRDISDPSRSVEEDTRAARTCNNKSLPCWSTGRTGPRPGYTGMEGLLNYLYYQGGALNQFDEVGHLLHFSLYDIFEGPCGDYNAAQDVPNVDNSGRTTNLLEAHNCVDWLGPTQPGINESEESICAQAPANQPCSPRYDDSVCPDGSTEPDICDPGISIDSAPAVRRARQNGQAQTAGNGGGNGGGDPAATPKGPLPDLPGTPDEIRNTLEDLLDLPGNALDDLGLDGLGKGGKQGGNGVAGGNVNQAAQDLLDFLFAP